MHIIGFTKSSPSSQIAIIRDIQNELVVSCFAFLLISDYDHDRNSCKNIFIRENTFDPSLRPGALRYPPDPRDGRDGRDPRDRRDLTEANQCMN